MDLPAALHPQNWLLWYYNLLRLSLSRLNHATIDKIVQCSIEKVKSIP